MARTHGVAILEDDWGSEMLSGGEYRPALRILGGANVLYVGSFTKKLWPSIRVGYIVAPPELVPSLVAAKRISTQSGAQITEAIVAEFLERGYYDGHLERLQKQLDARYVSCLELLRELMPPDVRWTAPGGGPSLWLELPRYGWGGAGGSSRGEPWRGQSRIPWWVPSGSVGLSEVDATSLPRR
jgi:GntR family transcriptional regulator/MocR family aminotransferase